MLLTAKTTIDSKLEGFEHGADEYITKPFSVSYFQTRIKNLLARRDEIQKYYRTKGKDISKIKTSNQKVFSQNLINAQDSDFIKTIDAFIDKRLGDCEFVVEDLAKEVNMSRSVFFKKMKGLTGLSPIEYIRERTMQKAAELLISGEYSVKEVSFMIGISDTKYFSRNFKKKFEMTPGEFKKRYTNKISEQL